MPKGFGKFVFALFLINVAEVLIDSCRSRIIADCLFKLGKLADAERYLKEAISNDATSATVYEHLGDVYQKQGKDELAKAFWQKP